MLECDPLHVEVALVARDSIELSDLGHPSLLDVGA
jgi:hypothetical protein